VIREQIMQQHTEVLAIITQLTIVVQWLRSAEKAALQLLQNSLIRLVYTFKSNKELR